MELLDIVLKGDHPMTIPTIYGEVWFRGFRGKDLNVKAYNARQMLSDGICLWPDEVKSMEG